MTDDAVTAQLARQAQQLDDLEQAVADLRTGPPPPAAPLPAAKPATVSHPRWATLAEFVEHVIAPLYAQHLTGNGTWCASWWDHEDARVRLEAVWRAWEVLRLEPMTGIARWLRDVADPQMDRLRDRDRGPFRACGDGKHLTAPPLPIKSAPAGFWDQP